jgi:hypothetical protein
MMQKFFATALTHTGGRLMIHNLILGAGSEY